MSWIGPRSRLPTVEEDAEVMTVGEVRRRFYRHSGSLASQVDVLARSIVKGGPAARARAVRAALEPEPADRRTHR